MISGALIQTLSMMSMIDLKRVITPFLLLVALSGFGQSSTGSTYNIFGVGTLWDDGLGAYRSVNNAAIGSRQAAYVNLKNPAALNAIAGPTQIFDVDVAMKGLSQQTNGESFSTMLGGLENINLWLKTGKRSGFILGASPFSDGRYDITDSYVASPVVGSYNVRYQGSGGITRFYAAASQGIGRYVSVGVRGSFLMGKLTSTQTLGGNSLVSGVQSTDTRVLKKFIVDFGTQLNIPLSEKQQFTIGVIYRPRFDLSFDTENKIIRDEYDSITDVSEDNLIFPEKYGVGLEYRRSKMSFSLDGELERWGVNGEQDDFTYKDQFSLAFGVAYQNDPVAYNYLGRVIWRAGYGYKTAYTEIRGTTFANSSFSVGLGLPVNRGLGLINLGYKYTGLGTTDNKLVYEQLHTFSLNISIRDLWFRKTVYD